MFMDHLEPLEQNPVNPKEGGVSRRTFLRASAAAGGGFLLCIGLPSSTPEAMTAKAEEFAPNAFIRIGRDGRVIFIMPQVEMGQGTYTSMSMLIAEELAIGLDQISVEPAPANDKLYGNPLIGFQVTGGSTSVRGFFTPLREAGAVARTMMIAAAAKRWQLDPATCRAEKGAVIDASGNRRLSYGELADEAARQPMPGKVALKLAKDFTVIGRPVPRIDSPEKVNGSARYGIDAKVPGMRIATVSACPVFGGTLGSVDDSKALAVKGVRQIVRLDNAVAVVADHMGAARKGLAALKITWDEGPNAHLTTADIISAMAAASHKAGVAGEKKGDTEAALKTAAKTVQAVYQLPLLAHTTMEPLNCTVHLQPDRCDIWIGSQVVARAQAAAAKAASLPLGNVAVHNHLLGGGFGRRLEIDNVTQAVEIARQVKEPVKIIWTREEDIQHDIYRPCYYDVLTAGLDQAGMPLSFHHRTVGPSIIARWLPGAFKNGLDSDTVEAGAGPYDFPNLLVDWVRHELPEGLITGWWRGVGVTHNAFMVEGFVDELAAEAGKDPVAYRRALLANSPRAKAVLDLAAEKAGWGKPMAKGSGRGVALLFGFGTYMAQVADVAVGKDGDVRVQRVVCAVDCGTVVNPDTVKAQVEGGIIYGLTAALYGDITIKNGRTEQSNFDTYQALRINEAPAIEVYIVQNDEKPGGMGEPATSAIQPAVVNAIFAATGKRLRKLPIDSAQLKIG